MDILAKHTERLLLGTPSGGGKLAAWLTEAELQ
jgi:hypothetical protein